MCGRAYLYDEGVSHSGAGTDVGLEDVSKLLDGLMLPQRCQVVCGSVDHRVPNLVGEGHVLLYQSRLHNSILHTLHSGPLSRLGGL